MIHGSGVPEQLPATSRLIAAWAIEYALGVCRRQARQAARQVRHFLAESQADSPARITIGAIADYLAGLRRAGRSGATVRNAASAISVFCDWAVRMGYIASNPAKGVPRPPIRQRPPMWLREAEARAALAAARAATDRACIARACWLVRPRPCCAFRRAAIRPAALMITASRISALQCGHFIANLLTRGAQVLPPRLPVRVRTQRGRRPSSPRHPARRSAR